MQFNDFMKRLEGLQPEAALAALDALAKSGSMSVNEATALYKAQRTLKVKLEEQ